MLINLCYIISNIIYLIDLYVVSIICLIDYLLIDCCPHLFFAIATFKASKTAYNSFYGLVKQHKSYRPIIDYK